MNLEQEDRAERLHIYNSQQKELELILEPEGHNFVIPPGIDVEIYAKKTQRGKLEIHVKNDNLIIVYGGINWVLYEGVEVYPSNSHPNWPPKASQ